jgi:glutamyl-Q tRNA(Asp) synthetase
VSAGVPETVYRGRFAPSPTGPLHFGSLATALGSFLDARANGGEWLVRIEDIDPPREQPGAADTILSQLLAHGLQWNGEVCYQSTRMGSYCDALKQLATHDLSYRCVCTRRQVGPGPYPGTCREQQVGAERSHSIRVRTVPKPTSFDDQLRGETVERIAQVHGDYIVRRSDNLIAYNLAVAFDDAEQQISDVVRGADLLETTARQIHVQQLLKLRSPRYSHLPVATDAMGNKLSKHNHAPPVQNADAGPNLVKALAFLGQLPPPELACEPVATIVQWGIDNWDLQLCPTTNKGVRGKD